MRTTTAILLKPVMTLLSTNLHIQMDAAPLHAQPPQGLWRRPRYRHSAHRHWCRLSETVRLLPPGLDLGATDDPVEAQAWKNMIFMRHGATQLTDPVHSTAEAAKLDAGAGLASLKERIGSDINRLIELHDGCWDHASNIGFIMQIPWRKE